MKAILLAALALWICSSFGRVIVGRIPVLAREPLERFAYSSAIGLGVAAYGVLGIGLLGFLSFWPVTLWWVALAVVGIPGMVAQGKEFGATLRGLRGNSLASAKTPTAWWIGQGAGAAVLLFGAIAILACFQPPSGREWDALAYHLANPKVFLAQGRITSLPTDHHSNFPFLLEMLFTVGLLYEGYALANLFHFLTGALTVVGMLGFCKRAFGAPTGWIGALLFVTTPLVLWEASTAYIDLGVGLYVALAAFAAVSVPGAGARERREWVVVAGAMMGFALGLKYLALAPFGLVGIYLALRGVGFKNLLIYAGLALAIGSPWYIKNTILLNNPVYPFYYKLFPQSRYWSADRAAAYQAEQDHFGYKTPLGQPGEYLSGLIQTPWRLLTTPEKYANTGDYTFSILIGGLFAGFCFAFLLLRQSAPAARDLLLLCGAQLLVWFQLAQISRYLVSLLPLFAVVSGYTAWRMVAGNSAGALSEPNALRSSMEKMTRALAVGLLVLQPVLMFWGLVGLPTNVREAGERGVLPTAMSLTEDWRLLTQPEERERYLQRLDVYNAIAWINQNTPLETGVALYDETRGFYLDRPYLWANGEHSSYIPYEQMNSGSDLTAWLRARNIQYALINARFSPQNNGTDPLLPTGPSQQEGIALQRWYAETNAPSGSWRAILGEAIRRGEWQVVYANQGVLVLKIGDPPRVSGWLWVGRGWS